MGTDEGDLAYMDTVAHFRENYIPEVGWACIYRSHNKGECILGANDDLDVLVDELSGEMRRIAREEPFADVHVGRVNQDGSVNIAVLCGQPIESYWDRFPCLSD